MKLFLEADGVTVEIDDRQARYQPDVLDDWVRRAGQLVTEQRALTRCIAAADVPPLT